MPTSGRPKAMKNSTMVSGQLRTTVTQAVPKARSEATGETRKAAITVPSSERAHEAPADDAQRAQEPGPVEVQVVE